MRAVRSARFIWATVALAMLIPQILVAQPSLLPPPRTIADITAILDAEQPSAEKIRKLRDDAKRAPVGGNASDTAWFYYDRSKARALLADTTGAVADAKEAVSFGRRAGLDASQRTRLAQNLMLALSLDSRPQEGLSTAYQNVQEVEKSGLRGLLFNIYLFIVNYHIQLGDLKQAEAYFNRSQTLLNQMRSSPRYREVGDTWEQNVARTKTSVLMAQEKYAEAETAFVEALRVFKKNLPHLKGNLPIPKEQYEWTIDNMMARVGYAKARLGRLAEGEADIRTALLNQLRTAGRYNIYAQSVVLTLASVLVEAGRYDEAQTLYETVIQTLDRMSISEDTQIYVRTLNSYAMLLSLAGKPDKAQIVDARISTAAANWEPLRRDEILLNTARIARLYRSNQVQEGLKLSARLLESRRRKHGERSFQTAAAQAWYAIGLFRAGQVNEASLLFEAALPVYLENARLWEDQDGSGNTARDQRLQDILETYFELIVKVGDSSRFEQSFERAEILRSRTVLRAVAAASVRTRTESVALSTLMRTRQDLDKQHTGLVTQLNNLLATSPSRQRDDGVAHLQKLILHVQAERAQARLTIERQFKNYTELLNPKPLPVKQLKGFLAADESVVSVYLGRKSSFAWAFAKSGAVQLIQLPWNAAEAEEKITELRNSLEQRVATIAEMEPFNLELAYEFYEKLLKPLEPSWKNSRNIIFMTNGALGLMPIGLLPVEPAQVDFAQKPLFSGYRNVQWLARTHSVTLAPSGSAIKMLRETQISAAERKPLIAFGDPIFSPAPAQMAAVGESSLRGAQLQRRAAFNTRSTDNAELASLPRLPDTAEEVMAIANTLGASEGDIFLQEAATEKAVLSADLQQYRTIVFATHGLMPGDLNGLAQPALAMTHPQIAGSGDGLLTVEEILGLKLNADWIILSACNTAAGLSAGAEANSGLGSAFFYAGARALLVTNWSVHSESAKHLVTGLFRREADAANLNRAQALQQAMLELIDEKGAVDARGEMSYSYAHPLFWAPYSVVGDSGVGQQSRRLRK